MFCGKHVRVFYLPQKGREISKRDFFIDCYIYPGFSVTKVIKNNVTIYVGSTMSFLIFKTFSISLKSVIFAFITVLFYLLKLSVFTTNKLQLFIENLLYFHSCFRGGKL